MIAETIAKNRDFMKSNFGHVEYVSDQQKSAASAASGESGQE